MTDHAVPEGEQYLWDGTGTPDAVMVALEEALRPLRHRSGALAMPVRRVVPWRGLAAAAVIVLAVAVGWMMRPKPTPKVNPPMVQLLPYWDASVNGEASVGNRKVVGKGDSAVPVFMRDVLATAPNSEARISISPAISIVVEADTRVKPLGTSDTAVSMALLDGSMMIDSQYTKTATQTQVAIVTPAGSIDIRPGTTAMIKFDKQGLGEVRVKGGMAMINGTRIPEQAVCEVAAGGKVGPHIGTPHFYDAAPALTELLAKFDATGNANIVPKILEAATKPRDTLALWHLLSRVDQGIRGKIADRIAYIGQFKGLPDEKATVDLDPKAMEDLWKELQKRW